MTGKIKYLAVSVAALVLGACSEQPHTSGSVATPINNDAIWPKSESTVAEHHDVEAQVETILAGMTLEQKIAQMIQPEIRDISVEDMRRYGVWLLPQWWRCLPQ